MIFRSIVGKLWLVILIFVVIILVAMNVVQTFVLKDIYYGQQSEQLIAEGQKLAGFINITSDQELVSERIKTMSDVLNATIVVVERNGMSARGYGHGYGGMRMGMLRRHFQMPVEQEDLEQLLEGKVVVHRGYHPMFEKELLWVAIPVQKDNITHAFIFIHAPLKPISDRVTVLRTATLHILGGVFLVTVVLSFFLSRSLSRPLLQMHQVAQSMTRGDYSRKVRVKSEDEIGLLADSLNSLSEELQEKISAIERLDQTRRDFVANVSHELRTPLTIIQGYTEAILDGFAEEEEERQKYLNNILDELLRLRRLVNDILDLRTLEAGRVGLNKQRVDMQQIIAKVVSILEPFTKEKEIQLYVNYQDENISVFGDPDRLEQVVLNLIDNAIRYTPVGGQIQIETQNMGNELKILISDSGPGIPDEELPLIWERFHKVDKARSRVGEGSGLGLAITKGIIQAHDGEIRVFSEMGRGTTMEFTIPIYKEILKNKHNGN